MAKPTKEELDRKKREDQKEKERREKEEKAKQERIKKKAERERKLKARAMRQIEKEKKEMKRIKTIIDYPFKALFQASMVLSLTFFIVKYFGQDTELKMSIFYSFLVFTGIYLGIGLIMIVIFYMVSEKKIKELQELKVMLRERLKQEEEEQKLREQMMAEEASRKEEQLEKELQAEIKRHRDAVINTKKSGEENESTETISPETGFEEFISESIPDEKDREVEMFAEDMMMDSEIRKGQQTQANPEKNIPFTFESEKEMESVGNEQRAGSI